MFADHRNSYWRVCGIYTDAAERKARSFGDTKQKVLERLEKGSGARAGGGLDADVRWEARVGGEDAAVITSPQVFPESAET